jgi:hypothetical protein
MSSNDRALSMMVALGLALTTACGGEQDSDVEGLEGESATTAGLGEGGSAEHGAAGDDGLVEKGGGILSGSPVAQNFGVRGFGEFPGIDWIVSSSQRAELVVALDVEPFTVSPDGCAVIEPTDPSLRRCVFRITFAVPPEAGTYQATVTASDIDGNTTSINLSGVSEGVILNP